MSLPFRIHPESGQKSVRHHCPTCSKAFSHRAQLAKHQQICDGKSDGSDTKEEAAVKVIENNPSSRQIFTQFYSTTA